MVQVHTLLSYREDPVCIANQRLKTCLGLRNKMMIKKWHNDYYLVQSHLVRKLRCKVARRLGSPQLYCLCSYVIDAFAFVGIKEKVFIIPNSRPCYFTTIFTVNLAKAWTPEIFLERNWLWCKGRTNQSWENYRRPKLCLRVFIFWIYHQDAHLFKILYVHGHFEITQFLYHL